jgi:hypothetical protein
MKAGVRLAMNLLVCFCIAMQSCSVEKRRYMRGYYVERNHSNSHISFPFANRTESIKEIAPSEKTNSTPDNCSAEPIISRALFESNGSPEAPIRSKKSKNRHVDESFIDLKISASVHTKVDFAKENPDSTKSAVKSNFQIMSISLVTGLAFALNQVVLDAVFRSIATTTGKSFFNGLGIFSLGLSPILITIILSLLVCLGVAMFLLLDRKSKKKSFN